MAALVPLGINASDPVVYVGASTQDFITRFDTVTGKYTKLAPAGVNATSFVVSPDGSTAYVARYSGYTNPQAGIDIVSLRTGKVLETIDPQVADSYTALALSADGSKLYFVGAGQLQVFDTASLAIVAHTPVKGTQGVGVALVAGGSEVYVSSGFLQAFDSQSLQEITINALPNVTSSDSLAASPDGNTLYVVTVESHTIASAIDTTTNTVVANLPYSNDGDVFGAAVSPDGQTLYLSNQQGLLHLSTATGALLGQLIATPLSGQIAPSPDGKYVYVNRAYQDYINNDIDLYGSNFPGLLQIDVATGAVQSLPIGGVAIAELVTSASTSLYVLQTLPYINTEDPDTVTVTGNLGAAGGTERLTASANGAVVAGVNNPTSFSTPGVATVTLLDAAARKITGQFTYTPPVGNGVYPYSFTMNRDGTVGYIGIYNESYQGQNAAVAVLKLPEGSVDHVLPVADSTLFGGFLAVSPDGSKLYSFFGTFCATDLQTSMTIGCSDLVFPTHVATLFAEALTFALNADGTRAYIPAFLTNVNLNGGAGGAEYLVEIDTSSLAVVATLALETTQIGYNLAAGASQLVYSNATNSVYIYNPSILDYPQGALVRVDLGTFTIAARQQVNYLPNGMAITPDGTQLLLTGSAYGTQIFDGTTLAYTGYIPGGLENGIVIPNQ